MKAPSVLTGEVERRAELPAGTGERFMGDQADDQACSRYFGSALAETRRARIELDWPGESTLRVAIPEAGFTWTMTMKSSPVTRALSALGARLPDRMWNAGPVLAVMGPAAGVALRAGRVAMAGRAPNGQGFVANPLRIWLIPTSTASVGDQQFGAPAALGRQARLGDFWIPQRGVFAIGRAFFAESYIH
jgi:hypothetical protein